LFKITPPPTGTFEVETLGPLGALADFVGLLDVSLLGEPASDGLVVDGAAAEEDSPAAVLGAAAESPSAAQAVTATAPPVMVSKPAARRTVRRDAATAGRRLGIASTCGCSDIGPPSVGVERSGCPSPKRTGCLV